MKFKEADWNNPEYVKQYHKQYREEHKEEKKQNDKKYRENHKEKIKQSDKKYYEKHKNDLNWLIRNRFSHHRWYYYHGGDIKTMFYGYNRRNNLVLSGICVHCGKNHVAVGRSVYSCENCLDKNNQARKSKRFEERIWKELF